MAPRCPACTEIENGVFDTRLAHCAECCRTWRADSSQVHCDNCHRQFSSPGFEIHRAGGVCRDPQTLTNKVTGKPRLRSVQRKYGAVWVKHDDRAIGVRPGEAA
jgi:hypothetical protein